MLHKLLEKTLKIISDDNASSKAMKEAVSKVLSNRYQTDTFKIVVNVTAIHDPRYRKLPILSSAESKEIFDHLEQLLIDMLLPCYSEDSLEAGSDERNEEQSSPLKVQPRGQGIVKMKIKVNSPSFLAVFLKLIQCLQDLHLSKK